MLLQDKRIFVVEDNLQNRVIFQMSLMRHGAFVEFERRGPDTLFSMKKMSRIDLIILDLMLADNVSGLDLYDEIRAVPEYANVPIVAVSAMDPAIAIPETQAKGFSGFIAKPINSRLFAAQLVDILEGKPVWYTGERT